MKLKSFLIFGLLLAGFSSLNAQERMATIEPASRASVTAVNPTQVQIKGLLDMLKADDFNNADLSGVAMKASSYAAQDITNAEKTYDMTNEEHVQVLNTKKAIVQKIDALKGKSLTKEALIGLVSQYISTL